MISIEKQKAELLGICAMQDSSEAGSNAEKMSFDDLLREARSNPTRAYLLGLDKEVLIQILLQMYIGRAIDQREYEPDDIDAMTSDIRGIMNLFQHEEIGVIAQQIAGKTPTCVTSYLHAISHAMDSYAQAWEKWEQKNCAE